MTRCATSLWLLGALACGGLGDETRFGAPPDAGPSAPAPGSDAGSITPAPLLPGEYVIVVPALGEQSPVHVSVLSATEAVVTLRFAEPIPVTIEATGEPLAVGEVPPGDLYRPPPELSGAYMLRASDPSSPFLARTIALGPGLNAAGGREALLMREVYREPPRCLAAPRTWETSAGEMRPDTEGTETRLSWPTPFRPWDAIQLRAAKPLVGAPKLAVLSDGIEAVPRWYSESKVSHWGSLGGWTELGGRTLQVSGTVVATNGVESAVEPATIAIFDLGASRSEPLTFGSAPAGLATWAPENVSHVPPGTDATCPAGCLRIGTGGAIGVRWQGPLASIRVRHRDDVGGWGVQDSSLDVTVASLSSPGYGAFWPPRADFWDEEIPVVDADANVFVWLSVDRGRYNPQSDSFCAVEFDQSTLIESIVPIPR
jgi:hypothetical protein